MPLFSLKRTGTYSIIAHCHLRWEGVWQRPQQYLSRLSKKHEVLFVEGPELFEGDGQPRYELKKESLHPSVTVMKTFIPRDRFHDGAWVDEQRHSLLREALEGPLEGRFDRPLQWFYDPMAAPCFLGRLNEVGVVYDCMDELSQFRFAPPAILEREAQLIKAADVLFAGGRKLHQSKARTHRNAHFFGCGVDAEHYAKALAPETQIPTDLRPGPVLGYFGVVDERLDYELINKLAAANPNWTVAIIGPTAKVEPKDLPRHSNLVWMGRREYANLPAYVKGFSACLMPFALNEATEYINPTKALEYLAGGKPVVSTAVHDVVVGFSKVVKVARSHDEFIQACQLAVSRPDSFPIAEGLGMARQNSWEANVTQMEKHIGQALEAKEAKAHAARKARQSAVRRPKLAEGAKALSWEAVANV